MLETVRRNTWHVSTVLRPRERFAVIIPQDAPHGVFVAYPTKGESWQVFAMRGERPEQIRTPELLVRSKEVNDYKLFTCKHLLVF